MNILRFLLNYYFLFQKKRPSKISELESQISNLKDELKKAKDELTSSEACKTKAVQEADAANEQLTAVTVKLEESQRQLMDFSAAEEARLMELGKISQVLVIENDEK